jgi:ubiquinone/menaquinone biosynthesis C-methylase UbiE
VKSIRSICLLTLVIAVSTGFVTAQHQHEASPQDKDRDRWMWQLPRHVIDSIGVKPGMGVADVGAGDGYFSVLLAERVGKAGLVYANDIDERALSVLRERCLKDKIENITIIQGKPNDPLLPEASVDLALLVNVIHLIEKPTDFLENLKPSLKPGGVIVFVQWDADKMAVESPGWDPEDRAKYSQQTTLRMIGEAGLDVLRTETFLPVQNIYICRPR